MILGTWLYVMSFSLSSQVVSSRVVFCRVMSCLDAAVASCLGTGPLMSCPFFGVAFHVHALSLLLVLCHVLFSLLVTCHVVSCNDFPCLGPLRFFLILLLRWRRIGSCGLSLTAHSGFAGSCLWSQVAKGKSTPRSSRIRCCS